MKAKVILDEKLICDEYLNSTIGIEAMALKYNVGKKRIKEILNKNKIQIKKKGGQSNNEVFVVSDFKKEKYLNTDEYHYIVKDINTDFISLDIKNKGGHLTSYIKKQYGVEIPTLYDRRMYYMHTGNYWWEIYLTYEKVENFEVKKCPFCDWTTIDIKNKSGAFEQHLNDVHHISKLKYLELYPQDRKYFKLTNKHLDRMMETDKNKFVVCKVCGKKLSRINNKHLKCHNLTKKEYIEKYGIDNLYSKELYNIMLEQSKKMNLSMDNKNDKFTSKPETEIADFIRLLGFECNKNRKLLDGQELDIFIPSKNIAIEYNGNKWHTELFGHKDKNYHINKLNKCNSKGIKLISIFEDEYINTPNIVKSKIKHILGIDNNGIKIPGRKCIIKPINSDEASYFLDMNHIQRYASATLHLGAFYNERLIAVMSFINEGNGDWNLSRFASDNDVICQGVGGKLFKYFTRNYDYETIKSFADRRWTSNINDNLYTTLGFKFDKIIKPDYRYYNPSIDRYKRFHKFGFRKQILHKKYGLPLTMTELEMATTLGYDRIWDCGLIKYVFTKK